MQNRKPINVVLDLDNTLIYSHEYNKANDEIKSKYKCYEMDKDYLVCERPNLQSFLTWLFRNFNVMVWSAASPDYVDFIVDKIVIGNRTERKIEYVFNSEKCDESRKHYNDDLKNLNMLWDTYDFPGYGPFNTLIVDDMGHVIKSQPRSGIRVRKFIANEKDDNHGDNDLNRVKGELKQILYRFKTDRNKTSNYCLVEASKKTMKKKMGKK
jgi:hypothetical protein